ncbi:MAG TPA: calcium-binding protein [Methylomirabilota bacterium]|jgi:Ca2+-binding RTX toxin-like protein|nr:calcium-binding protein [Methylomirabilota bacterium]
MGYSPTVVDAKELIELNAHAYDSATRVPAGWVVIRTAFDPESGLKAVAYQNNLDPTRIAVAVAGTQFNGGGSLDTDGAVLGNNFPQLYNDQLRLFLDAVTRDQPKDVQIAMTGHSLGGLGVQLSVPYLIDQGFINAYGVTFGALGAATVAGEAGFVSPLSSYAPSILNIVNAGDPIATIKSQIGQVVQIGEQGPIWRLLDVVTSVLFPTRPLYLAGAIAAFHALDEYQAKLDTVPGTDPLPPLQIDPTRDTPDNASALSSAFLSLRDASDRLIDPTAEIDLERLGKAYVLLAGEPGQPASLLTVPAEGSTEGMLVGLDRDGAPNLVATAGSVERIQGLVDGGARLILEVGPSLELESIDEKADGSGTLKFIDGRTADFERGTLIQIGGFASEQLAGSDRPDLMVGGDGDDALVGAGHHDQLYGGPGNDKLDGGHGNDKLIGGPGNDGLEGGRGNDRLDGGPGDDAMRGGSGSDTYGVDGAGNDWLWDQDLTPSADEVDTIELDPSITPDQVEVFQSGNDLVFRINGTDGGNQSGGTLWIEDGVPSWDDEAVSRIELVRFGDGTVWSWKQVLDRKQALPSDLLSLDPQSELTDQLTGPRALSVPGSWIDQTIGAISDKFDHAEQIVSPIVLDLDGDGVETTPATDGVPFDHNGDGFKERSGWAGSGDGFLVWDRDSNGHIDGGSELFGNRTPLRGGGVAANGFAALASWDGNADGRIDANDALWSNLRIWRDSNDDGVSEPDEITLLSDHGLTAINTAYVNATTVDTQGNAHKQIGSFTRVDGTTGAAEDVWFQADPLHSTAASLLNVPADVAALPDFPGYGTTHSLHQAMVRDASGTLKGLVESFTNSSDPNQRGGLVDQILFRWTGSDGINPAGRGPLMDARQVAVLEAFMGRGYLGYGGATDPYHTSAPILKEAYANLKGLVHAGLMAQTHLADLYDRIGFIWDETRGLKADLSAVTAELQHRLVVDAVAAQADLAEFARGLRTFATEGMLDYWSFRDAFVSQDPSLGWVFDSLRSNFILGTSGPDVLSGTLSDDALRGGTGNDVLRGAEGPDALYGDEGADTLWGQDGDDVVVGGVGSDQLYGGNGADRLEGGDGDDLLFGEAGDDALLGGAGNDQLGGGAGDDVLRGGDGTDVLTGGPGADLLDGGPGSDSMQGHQGNDVYLFGRGSGQDSIQENGDITGASDVIRLGAGIAPSDIAVRREGDHLVLGIKGTTDQLTVYYAFGQFSPANEMEAIVFADGTVWDLLQVKNILIQGTGGPDTLIGYETPDSISGLGGNDVISGRGGNDTLDGGPGADRLDGEAGDDSLRGGAGNDQLYGGSDDDALSGEVGDDYLDGGTGADRLDGGADNDSMNGGRGPDTYLFGRGSGQDTIQDADTMPGVIDAIQLASDLRPSDVAVKRDGDHLVLSINGTSDQLTVYNWFWQDLPDNQVEQVRFADGTVWDTPTIKAKVVTGTPGADTLTGYATADTLDGLAGNDTVFGRADDDMLRGGDGADRLYGETGNDTLLGGPGDDYLNGGAGTDTLDGGAGNDSMDGGLSGDTYLFGRGSGQDTIQDADSTAGVADTIQMAAGVLPIDVALSRNGDHLVLRINGTTDQLTVYYWFWQDLADNRVEQIRFADGTVWDAAAIKLNVLTGTPGADSLVGYATADTLVGLGGNDTIFGRAGDDQLDGGPGADTMYGEAGDDTYLVDNPADVAVESSGKGTDTVLSSVTYALPANIENLMLVGSAMINGNGNALDNVLTGNSAANILAGGAGNDTYVFKPGWGQDTVAENDSAAGNNDRLLFGGPVRPLDLVLSRAGSSLALALHGSADRATVQGWYNGGACQTEVIQAGDGSKLLSNQVDLLIQAMASYSDNTGLTWDQAIDQRPEDVQTVLVGYWQRPS